MAGTVDQLNRLAPLLDQDKDLIDVWLQKLPDNYRKLTRLGAYGALFPYYLCGLALRVTDLQCRTVEVGIQQAPGGARNPMLKYRGANSFAPDSSASVLIILIIAVGLNPDQLLQRATAVRYQALFADARRPGEPATTSRCPGSRSARVGDVAGATATFW